MYMQQTPFYKLSGLVINIFLIVFAFAGCKKQTIELPATTGEIITAKAGSKPGTYPVVSLRLTVDDAGTNITSDGEGDYINGVDNVKVVFDQYGNFMFSGASNNPNTPMPRYLNYNFGNPLFSYSIGGIERGNFISTGKTETSPTFTPLQNLAEGATQCIGFSAGLMNIVGGVVNFHRNAGTEDTPTTPTAYVYVKKVSSTQWIMTPVPPLSGGCSTISNVAALRINGALYGYYNMPFSFTLTKLP